MATIIAFPVKVTPVNQPGHDTASLSFYEIALAELVRKPGRNWPSSSLVSAIGEQTFTLKQMP
ncbi:MULTISPECIES: hypothetical protein [unclassified Rhizobium]|uniref:hypothetical protein n=1 Tax=unclassified Rhizobium TaxID=2613769 RepID=UPI001ADB7680|nr:MULTISPECIES: hypothetical protein [unclassified Rhizobium]MBO9101678.1 hypothetical protein [Rhizobium sp. L58/93]MBO9187734.1 hypothetical protein [Rhizobium sp. E27B/91]QXZ86373.1 hypothetical protein J5287_25360 [Rhizobium sp. K1/93]QXZ92172.1 hypothetical protein J5280_23825 [Rhizobium sp. K15/93]